MDSSSGSSRNSRDLRFKHTAQELIGRWRYRGHTGRLIRRHRALRSLAFRPSSLAHPLLLGAGFFAAVWSSQQYIARWWADILQFWCDKTGIEASAGVKSITLAGSFIYQIPVLHAASPFPTTEALRTSLILIAIAMLVSYLFLRRFLPLCYLVWAIALIHATSLVHFYLQPDRFPYSVGSHVSSGLAMALIVLLIIPLLLAVAYYPLNFALYKKVGVTVLMIGSVGIFAPLLYACHLVVMSHFSILYMPILFTVFGMLPIILMIVAIYGLAMSWAQG